MKLFGLNIKFISRMNLCIVVIVLFSIYITFFSDYNYMRIVEYDTEIKDLKAQIAATRDSFHTYEQKLNSLDSDPETLEKIVREEYHMKRDNEDVYIVKEK